MANERARGLGYKFVTDDKYLVNPFSPTEGISYEGDGSPVSYANSGIMAQAPIPAPLQYIPQGGSDNNDDDDDDINPYTGPSVSPWEAAKAAGLFALNPLGFLASKAFKAYQNRNVNKKSFAENLNKQEEAYNKSGNLDDLSNTPSYSIPDTNDPGGNPGGGYSEARNTDGIKSAEDDMKDGGRAGYFFGGRVNYKAGGRIGFQGGGMNQGNEENQKQSAEMGNTTVSNNNDSGNDNPPNFFVEDKTSVVDTSGLKSKSPEININYTDPKNYASLKSRVYNTNILKNDDLNVDGTLSGEIGPVSYNTNFTDQGITGTDLTAGNFNASIDANKNYNIGYANNYNGIDYGTTYDSNGNLMFNAGVKFKNGGLASIL